VLLVHDPRYGEDMISLLSRTGRGLPAHVVPFAVNEVTQIGLDFLLTAIVYGAAQVRLLAGPEHRDDLDALRQHQGIADAALAGLGYAGERILIDAAPDPEQFGYSLYATHPPPAMAALASYRVGGGKQSTLALALDHLHAQAPAPVEVLALPAGAPFGEVVLDRERCTLCLACVGACPTGALGDNPEPAAARLHRERVRAVRPLR
jgi:ferredoxin